MKLYVQLEPVMVVDRVTVPEPAAAPSVPPHPLLPAVEPTTRLAGKLIVLLTCRKTLLGLFSVTVTRLWAPLEIGLLPTATEAVGPCDQTVVGSLAVAVLEAPPPDSDTLGLEASVSAANAPTSTTSEIGLPFAPAVIAVVEVQFTDDQVLTVREAAL